MITFFAYHQDPERRQRTIDRIVGLIRSGRLTSDGEGSDRRMNLVTALGDDTCDLPRAHHYTGFTAPLLEICAAIHDGLPLEHAPDFALSLVKAAGLDADIADVPWRFLKWMFENAVAELGPSQIRTTTREAGRLFKQPADKPAPSPTRHRKAQSLAQRAWQQAIESTNPRDAQFAKALGAAVNCGGENAGYAVHYIAGFCAHPAEQYRLYARKMLELVESA